jgi:hypothetical protein
MRVSDMKRFGMMAAMAGALALGGCGGGGSLFGGAASQATTPVEQQQQGAGSTLRNQLLYAGPTVPQSQQPGFNVVEPGFGCPSIDIIENAAGFRGAGSGAQASQVSFQASITGTARECIAQGGQMRIRIGVEGRVLLGQAGRAGSYSVPLRIVVKRRADTVTQRFTRLTVSVPANDVQGEFSYVEENLTVPISSVDPADEFDIYVGLDPTGQQAARQQRRR